MTVNLTKSSATAEQIAEARDWIADAYPQSAYDMSDAHPVYEESAERVQSFTDRRYPGGWAAFVADCCTFVQVTPTSRAERIQAEPWIATPEEIVSLAALRGVRTTVRDIKGQRGDYTIDGMEWWAWLDAMTQA